VKSAADASVAENASHNAASQGGMQKMRLRYGFNEIDGWPAFSMGEDREEIYRRLRLMDTKVVRIFVFDKPVPDPFKEWPWFAALVQGVLDCGAKPMVTFAKFGPPHDDASNIRKFVARSTEIVWSCLEHWGGEEVKDWFWCVWNEPNNPDVGGDLRYKDYLRIYKELAAPVLELLEPHAAGTKVKLGGPSIDGTQRAYWMDWIAQFVSDVDDRMLGFVNWHMYADWRPAVPHDTTRVKLVNEPDAPNGGVFEALAMAQTAQYEARARGVGRLLAGRDILNVCGELNTIAHHEDSFTLGLNRNIFGAAYYASALVNLIRGGAHLEMRWTATSKRWKDVDDAYGLMSVHGEPTAACLAKQLFAQHVRYGDWVQFPDIETAHPGIDAIITRNDAGRLSAVLVNTLPRTRSLDVSLWDGGLGGCSDVLRLDSGTGGRIVRERCRGSVRIEGYGLAVLTDDCAETVVD
jgi:Glycosyl hydrolases family 39